MRTSSCGLDRREVSGGCLLHLVHPDAESQGASAVHKLLLRQLSPRPQTDSAAPCLSPSPAEPPWAPTHPAGSPWHLAVPLGTWVTLAGLGQGEGVWPGEREGAWSSGPYAGGPPLATSFRLSQTCHCCV